MSDVIAGYRRVSRVGDREETLISPEQQALRIEGYAESHGLEVDMLEPELDVSGGKVSRPILDRIIEGIEADQYGGIIVATLDRLSRMDIADALNTIKRIEDAGGRVIAVAENFDAGTPEGRLARNMFLSIGNWGKERQRAYFDQAKSAAINRGVWTAPKVPIGYKVKRLKEGGDGILKVDPANAEKVREAFRMRAAGVSFAKIGQVLDRNAAGARSVIRNRVYLGEMHVGNYAANLEAHEPIVDAELWHAAQVEMSRPPRNAEERPALLGGLIRCAGCQRLMRPGSNNYQCKKHYGAETCPAPTAISRKAVEAVIERSVLAELAKSVRIEAQEGTDTLEVARQELASADAELEAFLKATQAADVGAEHFADALKERADAVDAARAKLTKAQNLGKPIVGQGVTEVWEQLDVGDRRQVLRAAIDGCVWVKRATDNSGGDWSRVKISNLPDPLPRTGVRVPVVPVDWDNLPERIRVLGS